MKESKNIHTIPFYKVLLKSRSILKNPLPFHNYNFTKYGDSFFIKLGKGNPILFTRDQAIVKHILQKNQKNYIKSELQTTFLAQYIGNGLLTVNGDYWLKQRRLIQPAFHKKKLMILIDMMYQEIQSELNKNLKEGVVDVFPIMNDLAFKVVAKSLFSYDNDEHIHRLQEITEHVQEMVVKELRMPHKKWLYKLNGELKKAKDASLESREILLGIIEERRQSSKSYDDLLQMLLDSEYEDGSRMTNDQLIDEILILFVAGHETTSNALSFTLLLLAQHPKCQDKIVEELLRVDTDDLFEKMKYLQYTKQCVEEGMRLYPPAYFSDRLSVNEDEVGGVKIPKDTQVLMSFYELHKHSELWDNPYEFYPERFNPENKKDVTASYFPFGAGPRMCIGNNFAMYEMVLAVSEVIANYRLKSVQEIQIKPLITLKPDGALLQLEKR